SEKKSNTSGRGRGTNCSARKMRGVIYFRCTALSERFGPPDFSLRAAVAALGIAYFGLISWHPLSQYTPPAADSGVGIGEFTAISRSASSCRSTPAISSSLAADVSHFFLFT